jgi:uncharacterized iron-regulated protein
MSRVLRSLALLIVIMMLAVESGAHTVITRLSDRQNISMTQLAASAGNSDLILIGEVHDNRDHHDLQLQLIRALFSRKLQLAIGLEMIQDGYQQKLDEWSGGRLSEAAMQRVFEENWAQDWDMYRGIFIFARDNHIPMVALNVPLEIVRKVSLHGFGSLTPVERKGLPEGTSCDLSNPQIAILRRSFREVADHLHAGKEFNYFCEAQTVRNSGMAIHMARYLRAHPGQKMVGLTGVWHAVKYAIPDQLERYGSKSSYTVILPETPELGSDSSGTGAADYLFDL